MSHPQQVSLLADAGAALIQLREKTASPRDFFEAALASVEAAHSRGARVIVNDRVDIALTVGADGVHLGQDDLPPEKAREILGSGAIIGFSTHNLEQVIEAIRREVDYIAIGPIFATKTKADPDPTVGLKGLEAVRNAIGDFPVVAIGGIKAVNLQSVFDAGADCAAMISEIFVGGTGPAANFRRLLDIAKERV